MVSAKTGEGVNEVFSKLGVKMLQHKSNMEKKFKLGMGGSVLSPSEDQKRQERQKCKC